MRIIHRGRGGGGGGGGGGGAGGPQPAAAIAALVPVVFEPRLSEVRERLAHASAVEDELIAMNRDELVDQPWEDVIADHDPDGAIFREVARFSFSVAIPRADQPVAAAAAAGGRFVGVHFCRSCGESRLRCGRRRDWRRQYCH